MIYICTAISVNKNFSYFGRNLDFEHTFGEKIVITPKKYPFSFQNKEILDNHYAIIGMAVDGGGYPLYFDATNEKGLCMAGLNFPCYAKYNGYDPSKENIASFELIPWVLSKFSSVKQAKDKIKNINITDTPFSSELKPTPLHWMLSDKKENITIEQTKEGLRIFENPLGVLTNSPPFDMQMVNLNNYMSLTQDEPCNRFSQKIELSAYSRGMGAIGLPGDLSSMSRFVRASFVKLNAVFEDTEQKRVTQFFNILSQVSQVKGCARAENGFEMTNYSSCCNTDLGIYYYKTYYSGKILGVDMHREDLNSSQLISFELDKKDDIKVVN